MSNKLKTGIISLLIIITTGLSLTGGCILDTINPPAQATEQAKGDLNIKLLEEAYGVIQKEYVEPEKIDSRKLSEGMIKGLIQGLDDPYSAYLTKEQYDMSVSDFAGKFEGIGAYVGSENNRVTVIAPIPDTPADKAGIKPGDIILEVDGKSTENMSVTEVVLLIRGPKGTPVKLTVLHKGEAQPVTLEIIRAEIKLNSVRFEMKGSYAWVNITNFTEQSNRELEPVLKTISTNGAKGIILDLRRDPGGILQTVVDIASHFIKEGPIVHVVDREGNKETSSANRLTLKLDLPMVVLVDQYSASGSEVLAGALQDYKRALIAGQKTYGKGSVNQLIKLSDGSGIYITIARWLTPNGNLIEGKGIQPDTLVDFEKVDGIQWAIDYLGSQK
ncbi:MAG: S41 family peptidase [Dehalococcoidia bacterium]|nr:S41 family peptidase [Dehalococcoidia bacterium]